ncbi:GNAT family N-acetyltransferase [Mesoflavibacter profundi]|uniref:GNAT family N-acetyltransferase n=1 Tax=Mesoflavibacter profundi TaxID=2708110 RepID=A0ABT4S294_9FLAO|nr:GNAT family N-acetyltransferase [Mesoflavibacter profundi]MDA0178177.1 GNAT family N-acetyltransferase [Mesoflavibacter profundi]
MKFNIRFATQQDMPKVLELIKELAVFEKEPDAVIVTEQDLIEHGFGKHPLFTCFVAENDKQIVAIALIYFRFSTWKGKTVHLEDLIVKQDYRGQGLGTLLLDEVIKYGYSQGVQRVCWEVLDWNTNAIEFYKNKGAKILENWYLAQLEGDAIKTYIQSINEGI